MKTKVTIVFKIAPSVFSALWSWAMLWLSLKGEAKVRSSYSRLPLASKLGGEMARLLSLPLTHWVSEAQSSPVRSPPAGVCEGTSRSLGTDVAEI
jgi:hypothetical protein